jgi:hypothetical protein
MSENRRLGLIASVCLALGLTIGIAAGYGWGYKRGCDVNTIQVGPDFKIEWKNMPKPK